MEIKAQNKLDKAYLELLHDVMDNGIEKETRAGGVKSVFGRQLSIDLKEGFPLLTTKKVFTKGIIHELLWFLKEPYNAHNSMNIRYLVENNVHIWDDDAWRWFRSFAENQIMNSEDDSCFSLFAVERGQNGDETYELLELGPIEKLAQISQAYDDKKYFLELVINEIEVVYIDAKLNTKKYYRFGDLGPIYGKQWRSFGSSHTDQIKSIIHTLRNNPNDRRMLCVAFNPDELSAMALPPCHVMFQFYARELSYLERWEEYMRRHKDEALNEHFTNDSIQIYAEAVSSWTPKERQMELLKILDKENVPTLGLSCMFTMRSVDLCCGLPFNIASYALLTYMVAKLVNMAPDTLVASLGDCHIYKNHFDGVMEQMSRKGQVNLPKLEIKGEQQTVDDFKYENFEITGYTPDPTIKFPLNVGL